MGGKRFRAGKRKYQVLLDMSPVEGFRAEDIPLQDARGYPRSFKTKRDALQAYKKLYVGYFDSSGKYVSYKYKIVRK